MPYTLHLTTRAGNLALPLVYEHFILNGRTTDLIITDLSFGKSHLIYTSAAVLFAGVLGGRDVLVLHGDTSQGFEGIIKLKGQPNDIETSPLVSLLNLHHIPGNGTLVTFLPGIQGLIEVWDSDTQLILYCDSATAATFYAPIIASDEGDPFRNFWGIGTNASVLIGGPYLVRNATIQDNVLALRGDLQGDTMLRLVGLPRDVRRITWNGQDVEGFLNMQGSKSVNSMMVRGDVSALDIRVPDLGPWKYRDGLPETHESFDDSNWTTADHLTTHCPFKPYFGDGPVLYACDYGFCEGATLWRGTFDASGDEEGVRLVINGGEGPLFLLNLCVLFLRIVAFAASVWLNGRFVGTTYGK